MLLIYRASVVLHACARCSQGSGPPAECSVGGLIRCEDGAEFVAAPVRDQLGRFGVQTLSIEAGNPSENGSYESLNGKLRHELLNTEIFDTLCGAQILIEPASPQGACGESQSVLPRDVSSHPSQPH